MAEAFGTDEGLDLDDVMSLRQQLEDLHAKMQQAEHKKHTVKPKIFKKVKADYESRAKEIIDRLAEKASPLKVEYERVRKEESTLKAERAVLEEEMEEVKFRFSLGEYSKEEHDEIAGEKAGILERLEKDIAEVEKNGAALTDILKMIEEALRPKVKEEAPKPPQPEPREEVEVVEIPRVVEAPHAPEVYDRPLHAGGEHHGFHVLGEKHAAAPAPVEPPEHIVEPVSSPHTMSPLDDIVKELEQEMVTSMPSSPPAPEEQGGEEGGEEEGEEVTGARIKSEEEKELKCPKCGFVNMADSWYCEKCGAELLGGSEGGGG